MRRREPAPPRRRRSLGRPHLAWVTATVLVGLAAVGIAAALWSEQLTVNGTVETGDVDAGWTLASCADFDPYNMGEVAIAEADPTTGEIPGLDTINLTVAGAYPGYRAHCALEYTYFGTIPAYVEDIRFNTENLDHCFIDQNPTTGSFVARCDQLTVTWANGLCAELRQGGFVGAYLRMRVEDGAEQDTVYGFGLEVQLNQYSESRCSRGRPSARINRRPVLTGMSGP